MTEPLIVARARAAAADGGWRSLLARTPRQADAVNVAGALATARVARSRSRWWRSSRADDPARGAWYVLDAASGVFLAVIAVVGLLSALAVAAPARRTKAAASCRRHAPAACYYVAFHAFWAALLAVPLATTSRSPGCWSRPRPAPRRCSSPSAASAARSRPAGSTSCSPRSGSRSRCWGSSCSIRSRRRRRRPGDARLAVDRRGRAIACRGRRAGRVRADRRRAWRPRSAGRRCTTGCPTPTARRRRPSARCCRRRCCPPSCSSPGAC